MAEGPGVNAKLTLDSRDFSQKLDEAQKKFRDAVETQVLVPLIQLVAGQELAAFTAMLRRALPDAVLVPGEEELPAAWTRKLTVAPVKGLERMQAKAREYIEVSAARVAGWLCIRALLPTA